MTDFVDVNASRFLKQAVEEDDSKLIGQIDKGKQPVEIYNLFKQRFGFVSKRVKTTTVNGYG